MPKPNAVQAKGGRPPAKIDAVELEKLCALQCTEEEIACWFGVARETISRRKRDPEFAAAMERGQARGRVSIRRLQMRLLEQGNATMAVWLGKQYLGQTDRAPLLQIGDDARFAGSLEELLVLYRKVTGPKGAE